MKFKNIIWDWNGTIINDAWVFVDVMNGFLKQYHLPAISLSDYKKNFCFPIQDYWKALGFKFTHKSFNQLNTSFISAYQDVMLLPNLHTGMVSLLNQLHNQNLHQFILSASEIRLLQKSVLHYKINHLFKDVLGVDNLNAEGKKELGKLLFKQYNLKPCETLVIGDTEYDYEVAKALNCSIVLISHGHINHERLNKTCSNVVASVVELESFLQNN
jgi:phosphoglycolate phosphatase